MQPEEDRKNMQLKVLEVHDGRADTVPSLAHIQINRIKW